MGDDVSAMTAWSWWAIQPGSHIRRAERASGPRSNQGFSRPPRSWTLKTATRAHDSSHTSSASTRDTAPGLLPARCTGEFRRPFRRVSHPRFSHGRASCDTSFW